EDARGNIVVRRYDPDGNAIGIQETEVADVGSGSTFVTRTFVDELGRPIVRVSPLGNAVRTLYDSRGNAVEVADAQANNDGYADALDTYSEHLFTTGWPNVLVSGRGNRAVHTFDGV